MQLEYACFISYRQGPVPGAQAFYDKFYRELAAQVGLYFPNLKVFFDRQRLQGGDLLDDELAHALRRSVCLVALLTPFYFDHDHLYCAREYRAMIELERLRGQHVPTHAHPKKGFIIPIILRGDLPTHLKEEGRLYYDLDLLAPDDWKKQRYRKVLREIAGTIYERYQAIHSVDETLANASQAFSLPSEQSVREWLAGSAVQTPRQGLPY